MNSQTKRHKINPRYAAARPWDFKLCLDCGTLIPERCPACYGERFTKEPGKIILVAIRLHGLPPDPVQETNKRRRRASHHG
jgi:hypothetical protein